ncbi:MAG: response regulator transcription factor [Blautia sp.]|uniref:response regulator transcription factor n=1 Tax=Blautia sp. TaxID=1955243 RepID=UPI003991789E
MYRIFLVEDDETLCTLVKKHLESWGYEVTAAENFLDIPGEFIRSEAQLVLLDLKLPGFNGFHWCEEIRRISQVPIVFLSSAADNMNIVMAMSRGADDFISKPFDLEVLSAKVQAILRRAYSFGTGADLLERNGAILNLGSGTLNYQGSTVDLTRNELRILNLLFSQGGKAVSRESIMQMLWENDDFVDDNTLTVNVNRLRRKLEGIGLGGMIVTKKGLGYMVL